MLDNDDKKAIHGYVDALRVATDLLSGTVMAQGIGVSEKLDRASERVAQALDRASAASDRHAKSLVAASWALVFATVVLVAVTIYVAWTG